MKLAHLSPAALSFAVAGAMSCAAVSQVLPSTATSALAAAGQALPAGAHVLRIDYTNLTSGQILSPSAFASHNTLAPAFFQPGRPASFGLQRMAEEGNTGPTFSAVVIPNLGKLFQTAASALSALPGQTRSVNITVTPDFPLVSGYMMLVRTNDGFTGVNAYNGYALSGSATIDLYAYDAGTERNNEQSSFLVALDGSRRDPTQSAVRRHPGLRTKANAPGSDIPGDWYFDPAKPVVRITLTRVQ